MISVGVIGSAMSLFISKAGFSLLNVGLECMVPDHLSAVAMVSTAGSANRGTGGNVPVISSFSSFSLKISAGMPFTF
jgi:hypothetical protein